MSVLESGLIALLLKATVILVAVIVVHFALRRASAATRHVFLAMAMFGVVLLPFLSLSLPVWQLEVLPHGAPARPGEADPFPVAFEEQPETSVSPASPAISSSPEGRAAQAAGGRLQLGLTEWLVVIWALGAALVLARLAAGLLRMRWIARDGARVTDPDALRRLDECVNKLQLQVRPSLVASEHAGVPLVWGLLRPALILPLRFGSWSSDRMRVVMLHELGHLKRNDWPILLLGRIVAALYWFHPLAWFVQRCAKNECERACDDIVVTCGTRPSDYASHLLSIARGVSETPASVRAALAVVRRSQLNSRLRSILNPVLRRDNPTRPVITGLVVALLLILAPVASLQLTEQAYADEPKPEALLAQQQHQRQKMQEHLDSERSAGEQAYEKGHKLHSNGQYQAAIEAFAEARDLGFKPAASIYNIACCHALIGDARQAIHWLDRAFDAGFEHAESLVEDSDFDPIRRDTAFQEYIDQAFEAAGMERRSPEHYPYRSTLEAFEKLTASGSTHGKKWHYVGTKLLGMREYDLAIDALAAAVKNSDENSGTSMYNLACAHGRVGNEREALDWLERAVDAGFEQHGHLLHDTDLDNIRDTADFRRILDKSQFLSMDRIQKLRGDSSDRSAERWPSLIEEYRDYVGKNPSSGRGWFNLGYALHSSGQYAAAVDAFEQAASLNFRTSTAKYNIACANSMLDNTAAALNALEIAVESGKIHYAQLAGDGELDNLRDEPRFRALLERLEEQDKQLEDEQRKKLQMKLQEKITKKIPPQQPDYQD